MYYHARYSISRPPTEEIDSRFTLCKVSCLMIAVTSEDQSLRGQKRRRGAVEQEHSKTVTPHPKKAKRSLQSQQKTTIAYWDSLSKLWLTRRALSELDRRNRQRASPVRTTVAGRGILRDAKAVRQRRKEPKKTTEQGLLRNPSKQLKRFVRHGGPDLRDLEEVSLLWKISRPLLIASLQYSEPFTPNFTAHVMPSNQFSSRI